jgi:ProP effector
MDRAIDEARRLAEHRARERQSRPMNTEPDEQPQETAPTATAAAADETAAQTTTTPAAAEEAAPVTDVVAPAAPAAPAGVSPAECGARLAALFPALFIAPGAPGPFKPIKLRIHTDIQARAPGEFSKRVLGIFFSRYTTTHAYLKAIVAPGAQRFDLDGAPAGEIAEEHRAAAVEEIARRQSIAAERRAMQQPRKAPPAQQQRDQPPHVGTPTGDAAADPRARSPRPPREQRPQRDAHEPRRDSRPPARGADSQQRQAPHALRPARRDEAPRSHAPTRAPEQAPTTALPADPAQRERAVLLRSFEASTISKANFCALKRMSEAELDVLLAQARSERR